MKRSMLSKCANIKVTYFLVFVSLLATISLPAQGHQISIQLAGKLILIPGIANGKKGFFILDTGAVRFTLNSRHFQQKPGVEDVYRADVQIGDLKWKHKAAILWDLSYLEQSKGKTILGLLNGKMFADYQIVLDLAYGQILLVSSQNRNWSQGSRFPSPTVLPIKRKGDMPTFLVEIGGFTYRFGLDTGAECNLAARELQTELQPYLYDIGDMAYRRSDKKIQQTKGGKLEQMKIDQILCQPMRTLFGSLQDVNRQFPGASIDGLLGYEFLRQFIVAINFKTKKIAIWPQGSQIIAIDQNPTP